MDRRQTGYDDTAKSHEPLVRPETEGRADQANQCGQSRESLIRNEAHVSLDRIIRRRQGQAREDIHNLLLRVRIFGDVLVEAYGRDINRLELIEALEKEFCQGLRDIR